jgi:hypothetical protein
MAVGGLSWANPDQVLLLFVELAAPCRHAIAASD